MNVSPLLEVKDLAVHFPIRTGSLLSGRRSASLKAVDGVSFSLQPGETLGIVGESGCGKSTLGRAVLRLIEPTSGNITWLGRDFLSLDRKSLRDQRRDMQIVFQDALASLNPRMTIGDIIAEPLMTFERGLNRTMLKQRVQEMMAKTGLKPEMINRYPHEFSGGQCQRIGIARAMILEPKLIICDEPVSALDVSIQGQIINLLMQLQRDFNLSLVFISHDLSVVRHISHRVMVLYLGKVMEIARGDRLYDAPKHPYTKALISAVPIPNPRHERNKQRVILKGDLPSPLDPSSGCVFRTRCGQAVPICTSEPATLTDVDDVQAVACHRWRELGGGDD